MTPAGKSNPSVVSSTEQAGEKLGARQVSKMPLEQRDSTSLLLLASGITTTTGNGGNFTQQYSVHATKGTTAVFALDGGDTTDPELGGATIADFNVDAIQAVDSISGFLPASIGEGAVGYTNIMSKSGTAKLHGDAYEFIRNSALDARNYFDPHNIPPFVWNEFGITVGGPAVMRRLNRGNNKMFFYAEYQGLRQMQGATEVLSVPTQAERNGQDITAFPGDTLFVPINPQIRTVLGSYPLPNSPGGAYGARTYATSSKVVTSNNQFSVRLDRSLSGKDAIMGRVTVEDIVGPITNPDQTLIDPSYAQLFTEGYRSATVRYARVTASDGMSTQLSVIRSTPQYSSLNYQQPALTFSSNLFEAANSQAGGFRGTWGNLLQFKQTFTAVHAAHSIEAGGEIRVNRDSVAIASNVNGNYSFGAGPVYSPLSIMSASGRNNINAGDLLPDVLSAFLTGTPFSYSRTVGGEGFPQGTRIGEAGVHREAFNLYVLDNWRATPRVTVNYGLRYEINSRLSEPHQMTQGPIYWGPSGQKQYSPLAGATQQWVVNPQPGWKMDWNSWGPRVGISWRISEDWIGRISGGITSILPFPFPNTGDMNSFPFSVSTAASTTPGVPIAFNDTIAPLEPPPVYDTNGNLITSGHIRPNTIVDVARFQNELAALLPGNQVRPLQGLGQSQDFANGYITTSMLGIQRQTQALNLSASYIRIIGVRLQGQAFPNAYTGASPGFAPFARFDASGRFLGGFGQETLFDSSVHSSYDAGELTIQELPVKMGISANLSYTFSHAIDNAVGGTGGSGTVRQGPAQDPTRRDLEKGTSSLNVHQNLAVTTSIEIPSWPLFQKTPFHVLASGWSLSGIGKISSGLPFSIYSGIQQTGFGAGGGDRPDQVGIPTLTTNGPVKEDYFGRGAGNASYFSIPINIPGGTGPYKGRPGRIGRNTFIGPSLKNFDLAVTKGIEMRNANKLEFRGEFYNVFNFVVFGLPNNVVTGSGFGVINATASNSRQLQFSLKWIY
jgi:hypothetical protein